MSVMLGVVSHSSFYGLVTFISRTLAKTVTSLPYYTESEISFSDILFIRAA